MKYVILIFGVVVYFGCTQDETKLKSKACFDYSPKTGLFEGDTLTFSNCSENSSKSIWDFGDGHNSTESSPKHTYENDGTYNVKLLASNDNSVDTLIKVIEIEALPGTAELLCIKTWSLYSVLMDGTDLKYIPNEDELYEYWTFNEDGTVHFEINRTASGVETSNSVWSLSNSDLCIGSGGEEECMTIIQITTDILKVSSGINIITFKPKK